VRAAVPSAGGTAPQSAGGTGAAGA